MQQQEIHNYLKKFFLASNCYIEHEERGKLTVQLSIEMDKALMNRPFYWHYIEKTGGAANPQKLTLVTDFSLDEDNKKSELIHFGSPRLHQIFANSKDRGKYIRLYENQKGSINANVPLMPWLCLNVKISYISDLKKDQYRSVGLNLINGVMIENFHEELCSFQDLLTAKIPDFSFTLSPLIKPISGIRRIEQYITKNIQSENHTWAVEAKQRWDEDEQLLEHFYEDMEEKPERYISEKEALKEQYEPKIDISIINGGIFYLTKNRFLA